MYLALYKFHVGVQIMQLSLQALQLILVNLLRNDNFLLVCCNLTLHGFNIFDGVTEMNLVFFPFQLKLHAFFMCCSLHLVHLVVHLSDNLLQVTHDHVEVVNL